LYKYTTYDTIKENIFDLMAKKASPDVVERFLGDLKKLRRKYSNEDIGHRTGIDPANLSSYRSRAKNPGPKTLNKFYMQFEEETQIPSNEEPTDREPSNQGNMNTTPSQSEKVTSPETEEQAQVYHLALPGDVDGLRRELFHVLKANNEHLQESNEHLLAHFDKFFDMNREMVRTQNRMFDTQDKMVDHHGTMIRSHENMTKGILIEAETTRHLVSQFVTKKKSDVNKPS
jgi:hypothetical protein